MQEENISQKMIDLFKGRLDNVGQEGSYSRSIQSEAELAECLKEHLDGKKRLGIYNLLQDATCPWAVAEFEDHGALSVQNPAEESLRFMQHMNYCGISVYRELSKDPGGKCYHVWMFFESPISAKKIHHALKNFLSATMGINVEVFPKGYDPKTIGNFVNIPLFGGKDSKGDGILQNRTVFVDEQGLPFPDQSKFILTINRNTHDSIDKLIASYQLKTDRQYNLSEADLPAGLDKLRQCPFVKYCEDNAATLPEPLWYAWITNAVRVKEGRSYIHDYSKLYPKYSWVETDRKIAHALQDTGPMSYEEIINLGWQGVPPADTKYPINLVYRKDIDAEIAKIKLMTSPEEKETAIKVLVKYGMKLSILKRKDLAEKLKKEFKIDKDEFNTMMRKFAGDDITLDDSLPDTLELMRACKMSKENMARTMFEWMELNDMKFFFDRNSACYALIEKRLVQIAINNPDFKKFFFDSTDISLSTNGGAVFVDVICNLALNHGTLIEPSYWLYTNRKAGAIYISLNNEENQLAFISQNGVVVVDQADNEDKVVLSGSTKLLPITYCHLTDYEYKSALQFERDLVVNAMACSPVNRIFVTAWRICAPLLDFAYTRPIIRFEGKSSSGKSFAFDLISYLLYGEDHKKISTVAGNYSDAAQNPLLLLDNMEARNMSPELNDFLLLAAVGATKEKRKSGTDTGIQREKSRCMILMNGIENLSLNEIINRTYIIQFDRAVYGSSVSTLMFDEINMRRNKILSAEFLLLSKILKRRQNIDHLKIQKTFETKYPDYSKSRSNEYFTMMIMAVEELLIAWGDSRNVWDLVDEWVKEQEDTAQDTSQNANPIVLAVEALMDEAERALNAGTSVQWPHPVALDKDSNGKPVLTGKGLAFHQSFEKCYRGYSLKNPKQLAKRINDAEDLIIKAGFSVEIDDSGDRNIYTIKYEGGNSGSGTSTTSVPGSVPNTENT